MCSSDSPEESGHSEFGNWVLVQERGSSVLCQHDNCVAVCVRIRHCCRDSVGAVELIHLQDQGKFLEIAGNIETSWGLPQCIGAIDRSYIPILAPPNYHCYFFNRMGWHSIILQDVLDGKVIF